MDILGLLLKEQMSEETISNVRSFFMFIKYSTLENALVFLEKYIVSGVRKCSEFIVVYSSVSAGK